MSSPIEKKEASLSRSNSPFRSTSQHLKAPLGQNDRLSTEYFDSSSIYSQGEDLADDQASPTPRGPRRDLLQYADSPTPNSSAAGITFHYSKENPTTYLPQQIYTPPHALETPVDTMHTLNEIDNAFAPQSDQSSPYASAPSLMPPPLTLQAIASRHITTTHLTGMSKSGDFGQVILKLDAIAQMAEKIQSVYGEGASFARCLVFPGEIDRLSKTMATVTAGEFTNLDVAVERKLVVSTKWAVIIKTITNLSYTLKTLPAAHPNRSKLIKDRMLHALEGLEDETEKLRAAAEGYLGEESDLGGKKIGKGVHLVTLVSSLLYEWRDF